MTHEDSIRARMSSYLDNIGYTTMDSSNFHYYSESDFRNSREYSGRSFSDHTTGGIEYKVVNFLGDIQAAKAYSKFYGYDSNNNLVSRLGKTVTVGVIDTGVNSNNKEFKYSSLASGTKVFGHNFDYGPCNNGVARNCWVVTSNCIDTLCYSQKRVLYDANGNEYMADSRYELFKKGNGALDKWAAMYPSNYVWEEQKDNPAPLVGKDPLTGSSYAHGTHIAGIIAANWDRSSS